MSILVTGFEPFGGADVNPSWQAVSLLPDSIMGHEVHRMMLPTVYGTAAEMLLHRISQCRPAIVLCSGVASGRQGVTPELVAINYRQARIADNAGQQYTGEPIDPAGETAFMTSLPVNAMVQQLRDAGIPASLSLSAGAFVCNDVYYALLRSERTHGHRGLFVHVPDQDAVSAQEAARALTLCLQTALSEMQDT